MESSQDLKVSIEKPRLSYPVSLVIDDGVPCINLLHYYNLQVIPEKKEKHEPTIPLDLMEQFAEVVHRHGIRGKFTVIPYPAGLGTILDGWEGCDHQEMECWLEIARSDIGAQFDITPEILTHTLALDLQTHQLIPQSEQTWMDERNEPELETYMRAAVNLLRRAGFQPSGITQPVTFTGDRAAYARAVLEAIRPAGPETFGTLTFYFIDFEPALPPVPPHPVVLLDREKGDAVVSILCYADDFFWNTQYPVDAAHTQGPDNLITSDGKAGRLVELIRGGAWTTFVTHWQSLYSNGARLGLAGLDETASRLERTFGSRLMWVTNSQVARYRAAEETCQFTPLDKGVLQIDAAFDCPDFTFSLQTTDQWAPSPAIPTQPLRMVELTATTGTVQTLIHDLSADDGLMLPSAWRQSSGRDGQGDRRVTVCFDLKRGIQVLKIT